MAIWNSWMASWGRFCKGPPTTSSLLSAPSRVTLPPRPSWPAEETTTEFVFVGSKFGAGELPGTRNASSMKLRPFRGRRSMAFEARTPCTTEERLWTARASVVTSTVSLSAAASSFNVTSAFCPTWRVIGGYSFRAKALARTRRTYEPGARSVKTNVPRGSAAIWRSTPVAVERRSTLAPATAAPCGSVTRPRRVAVAGAWANALALTSASDNVAVVSFIEVASPWAPGSTEKGISPFIINDRARGRRPCRLPRMSRSCRVLMPNRGKRGRAPRVGIKRRFVSVRHPSRPHGRHSWRLAEKC